MLRQPPYELICRHVLAFLARLCLKVAIQAMLRGHSTAHEKLIVLHKFFRQAPSCGMHMCTVASQWLVIFACMRFIVPIHIPSDFAIAKY